jgi:hypothetical protein
MPNSGHSEAKIFGEYVLYAILRERDRRLRAPCYLASMHGTATTSVNGINETLKGFTDVAELSLISGENLDKYDLKILLFDGNGGRLLLTCKDVSNLRISEFGGGLTQFLAL